MENKVQTPAQKGLLLGLLLVAVSVLMYVLMPDMATQQKYAWISYALIILALVWACSSFAKQMDHNVTFGQVFSHGFKTTAVITLIMVAYTILAFNFLFPEMKDKALEVARQSMEKDGNLTETQIDQALSMTSKYFVPFAIAGALIGTMAIGALGSLIGASIVKKQPRPFND